MIQGRPGDDLATSRRPAGDGPGTTWGRFKDKRRQIEGRTRYLICANNSTGKLADPAAVPTFED